MIGLMNNLNNKASPLFSTTKNPSQNVNHHKNANMNKSAVLVDKFQIQFAQELPAYVVAHRKQNSHKSIKLNRGMRNMEYKNKTIQKILQASIKQAMKQTSNRKLPNSDKQLRTKYIKKQKVKPKPYPQQILNLLYRQRIKNYNPYIQTLSKLDEIDIEANDKQKIMRLCYIGVARDYFQKKKYFAPPNYSRVCILIRTYMMKIMRGNMQQKMASQPHSVYIPINQTALSFNPYARPKQFQNLITKKKFGQIIKSTNKIITKQYENYKKGNFESIKNRLTYSQIFIYLLLAIIIICVVGWDPQFESYVSYIIYTGMILVVFGGLAMAWLECKQTLSKVCPPSNVTTRIVEKIRQYFKSVSDESLTWRIGPDFYWLQIQNINIQKGKFDGNNSDNF